MTFHMCRALVEACTPDRIQVDPFAADQIQKSCIALALALKWYSKKQLVGADAIITDKAKTRIHAKACDCDRLAYKLHTLNELFTVDEFIEVCPNMVKVKFFEWNIECTEVDAENGIMTLLTAMLGLHAIMNSYKEVVRNELSFSLFFGVNISAMNTAVKALLTALRLQNNEDEWWSVVEQIDDTNDTDRPDGFALV